MKADDSSQPPVIDDLHDAPTDGAGDVQDDNEVLDVEDPAELADDERRALLSALLFSTGEVLDASRLQEFLRLSADELDELALECGKEMQPFGLDVLKVAGGYRMVTASRWDALLTLFHRKIRKARLSKSALEILAIVAYEQPVSRSRIDELRQVNSESTVRSLLERRLITIAGRSETPGRPFLYRTTPQFLDTFGISALDDLPPRPVSLDFAGDGLLEGPFAELEELDDEAEDGDEALD
jgi:segregation and condensation protein B